MADWYRVHNASPDYYPDGDYREWAQNAGAHVDEAGNVIWPDQEPLNVVRAPEWTLPCGCHPVQVCHCDYDEQDGEVSPR